MTRSLAMPELDAVRAGAIAGMVLAAIGREYPVHLVHLVQGPEDVRPARELWPAFHGSFDWHSCVHGHWALARLLREVPDAKWRGRALAALAESLTPEHLAGELRYLGGEGRQGFERPYGLAWLLQLAAELRAWSRGAGDEPRAAGAWLTALVPLETLAAERIVTLLERLPWPVRGGEHAQTAFALGLTWDWAAVAERDDVRRAIAAFAARAYQDDRDAPVAYEPSGHDFLSPTLGEADLMRRVLAADPFAAWLDRYLPAPDAPAVGPWLTPVTSPDRADGKLSHLDGLNLSRAWMLEGIARALAAEHRWRAPLEQAARRHAEAGLAAVPGEHYAGTHWLGSFAVYLLTARGLEGGAATA